MESIKIPIWLAIITNINIVVGVGFFLGAQKIASSAGLLAPVAWLACGLMLFPLMIVFARLAERHREAGGIYVYSSKELGPWSGFVSGWGYFIGTSAANACVIHAFCQRLYETTYVTHFMQQYGFGVLVLDVFFITLFALLNLTNSMIFERFQLFFTILKAIPLGLVLVAVPFLFDWQLLTLAPLSWKGLIACLPAVLFGFVGLEACCAIADKLKGDRKSTSFVIYTSFALITSIYVVLQFALLGIHGTTSCDPFLSILSKLTSNEAVIFWGNKTIYFTIVSALLANFYGTFYFNNWNLYAIGKEKSIMGYHYLQLLNRNAIPWICVVVQGLLTIGFVIMTDKIDALYSMGDVGTLIAYVFSAVAFLMISRGAVAWCALGSCLVLTGFCTGHLLDYGLPLLPFWLLFLFGLVLHYASEKFVTKVTD